MTFQSTRAPLVDEWVKTAREASPEAAWLEAGNNVAAVLEFDSKRMPNGWRDALGGTLFLGIAGIAFSGVVFLRFPWQTLKAKRVCSHCVQVHTRIGWLILACETGAAACLCYLVMLPLAAALFETSGVSPLVAMGSVIYSLGLVSACVLVGMVARALFAHFVRQPWREAAMTADFLVGASVVMAVAAFLAALLATTFGLLGIGVGRLLWTEVGERLLLVLGEPSALLVPAFAGFLLAVIALIARWILPYRFDSRPVELVSAGSHAHTPIKPGRK